MTCYRFDCVLRAGRVVTAESCGVDRDAHEPECANAGDGKSRGDTWGCPIVSHRVWPMLAGGWLRTPARRNPVSKADASCSNGAKAADGLVPMTMSHFPATRGIRAVRAAFRRRRTRLRTTAFPTRRETTIPNLAQETELVASRVKAVIWIGPALLGRAPLRTFVKSALRRSRCARAINFSSPEGSARQRAGRGHRSDREALPPLLTTKAQYASPVCAAHPLHEAVDAGTAAALGLPGSLHKNTPTGRARPAHANYVSGV